MIDLHVHSTFSDGSHTPEELAELASTAGLTAVALTDHDCTDGVPRLVTACEAVGVEPIPGVEISVATPDGGMHLLGYFVDIEEPCLQAALQRIRAGREIRNREILQRLHELGVKIEWSDVAAQAEEDVIGRPHFAHVLVAEGYVPHAPAAFDRYLARGKAAYVDRYRLTPEEGIAAIRGAGGVAVLAHPSVLGLKPKPLRALVGELRGLGLGGLEVYYSEHRADQVDLYRKIARENGLAMTGGSDFHGAMNRDVNLGRGFGGLRVPDCLVGELKARTGGAVKARETAA